MKLPPVDKTSVIEQLMASFDISERRRVDEAWVHKKFGKPSPSDNIDMFDTDWIKSRIINREEYFSKHAENERQNDNLTIAEVREALLNGMILEQYPDTGRGESCLVVGFTNMGKPIHIVCGERTDKLIIITVYIPSPPKFRNPYERG